MLPNAPAKIINSNNSFDAGSGQGGRTEVGLELAAALFAVTVCGEGEAVGEGEVVGNGEGEVVGDGEGEGVGGGVGLGRVATFTATSQTGHLPLISHNKKIATAIR